MEIKIDSKEILTSDEVKRIVCEEVRAQVRNYFEGEGMHRKEGHINRLLSNSAYDLIFDDVHKIVPNYENEIATKVAEAIQKLDPTYHIWKKKNAWESEEGFAQKILENEVKKNEGLIREKIQQAIENHDYTAEMLPLITTAFDQFTERIMHALYDLGERKKIDQ